MYTETIEYWDDLCPESYKIVLPEYNLQLMSSKKIDDVTTELVVTSQVAENLKRFMDDFEEGDLDPLDVLSRECDSDDDYVDLLNDKIS